MNEIEVRQIFQEESPIEVITEPTIRSVEIEIVPSVSEITIVSTGLQGPQGPQGEQGPMGLSGVTRSSMIIFTISGTVAINQGTLRILNVTGKTVIIRKVVLSVGLLTPPTGASLIVDLNKNGSTIFTDQLNRPLVLSGEVSGQTTIIDSPNWSDGEWLTMDVDQVGSSLAGSDLTVHVVYD